MEDAEDTIDERKTTQSAPTPNTSATGEEETEDDDIIVGTSRNNKRETKLVYLSRI